MLRGVEGREVDGSRLRRAPQLTGQVEEAFALGLAGDHDARQDAVDHGPQQSFVATTDLTGDICRAPAMHKTISELIYVPNDIFDGTYILNLMIAPFENDASPSKPVLYQVF